MRTHNGEYDGKKTHFIWTEAHEVSDMLDLKPHRSNKDKHTGLIARYHDGEQQLLGKLQSLKKFKKLFREGWAEGAARAIKLADGLEKKVSTPKSVRRRARWSDEGDEYCKFRVMDGYLDRPWRTMDRAVMTGPPIIRIVAPFGGHAGCTEEELFWSGAATVALSNKLERSGYRTEIYAVCSNGRDGLHAWVTPLKRSGSKLNISALAAHLCHVGTYRVFGFMGYCNVPWNLGWGLGKNAPPSAIVPALVDAKIIKAPHVTMPDCYNETDAKAAVERALKDIEGANLAALAAS